MIVELLEKTNINGDKIYYIEGNGKILEHSYTVSLTEASNMYDEIIKNKSIKPLIQVLKSEKIDVSS